MGVELGGPRPSVGLSLGGDVQIVEQPIQTGSHLVPILVPPTCGQPGIVDVQASGGLVVLQVGGQQDERPAGGGVVDQHRGIVSDQDIDTPQQRHRLGLLG